MANQRRRGFPAMVFKKEDKAFYGGRVVGPLQKRHIYKVRYNGEKKVYPVDSSEFEFRGGAMPWRKLKPGDRVLAEPFSRPGRTYSLPNYFQNTSWSNNMIGEQRSAYIEGVVKRLPRPSEGIRRYKVVVRSRKKRKTLHVSRQQIKPLGGNIEKERLKTATPKVTISEQEKHHVSRQPIKPLGGNIEKERLKTATPKATISEQEKHQTKEKNVKRTTSPVSRQQTTSLGVNIENERPKTAPSKHTNIQHEKTQKKDEKVKRTTPPVSKQQIETLDAQSEDNRPKTALPIPSYIQQVKTKDKNIQAPESEPFSGVILARWRDDGWFYFGMVVSSKDDQYFIKDGLGFKEMIHKSDVLTETNQKFQVVQPDDKVIALHPNYIFSYAPASVKRVYRFKGADLKFYDNTTGTLPWSKIYKISDHKYADYVQHIEQKEKEMLHANVIVLDEMCGHFENGTVSDHSDNQMYSVTLTARNEHLEQQANHIFLSGTILSTDVNLKSLKYVIGRVNDVFLSGEICKSTDTNGKTTPDETITVFFCNHQTTSVRLNDVYPINKNYFDFAVDMWKSCQ